MDTKSLHLGRSAVSTFLISLILLVACTAYFRLRSTALVTNSYGDAGAEKDLYRVTQTHHHVLRQTAGPLARSIHYLAETLKRQESHLMKSPKNNVDKESIIHIKAEMQNITEAFHKIQKTEGIVQTKARAKLSRPVHDHYLDEAAALAKKAEKAVKSAKAARERAAQEDHRAYQLESESQKAEESLQSMISERRRAAAVRRKAQLEKQRAKEAALNHQLQVLEQQALEKAEDQARTVRRTGAAAGQRPSAAREEGAGGGSTGDDESALASGGNDDEVSSRRRAAARRGRLPCDAAASDYLDCLGVRATGATLAPKIRSRRPLSRRKIASLVSQAKKMVQAAEAARIAKEAAGGLEDKQW